MGVLSKVKTVFVTAYKRYRFGRWEDVCQHWRSHPRRPPAGGDAGARAAAPEPGAGVAAGFDVEGLRGMTSGGPGGGAGQNKGTQGDGNGGSDGE